MESPLSEALAFLKNSSNISQFFVSLMLRLRRRGNGGPKFPFRLLICRRQLGANDACGVGGT